MYRAAITGSIVALALSGCMVNDAPQISAQQQYYTGLQDLRDTSMRQIDLYADSVTEFLKTHKETDAIERAKRVVADDLKDPGSAQFRNVRLVPYGAARVICGEVNGKNSYGGYVGFVRFAAGVDDAQLASKSLSSRYAEIDDASKYGVNTACP